MASQVVNTDGSSVGAGRPRAIAAPASRADPARLHSVTPASRNARSACAGVRFAIAARRMPGAGVPSCRAMARPVAPAPTMPTRIGLFWASRARSAGSTIILLPLPLDERPVEILFRDYRGDQGPLNVERRIIESQATH